MIKYLNFRRVNLEFPKKMNIGIFEEGALQNRVITIFFIHTKVLWCIYIVVLLESKFIISRFMPDLGYFYVKM